MNEVKQKVRVAAVQAAPVLFDKAKTIEKTCDLLLSAGAGGAEVALLPEAFVAGYPRGFSFGMVVGSRTDEGRALWKRCWDSAVEIPGPDVEVLGRAVKSAGLYTAIGVIEKDMTYGRGTLYCTLLYMGPDGRIMGKHRKLKPTGAERLIWGEGDGSTLSVFTTPVGRLGGLICWENYMPLARMAMYGNGVQIYLAPTADSRDTWQATLRHIACEGRCFVLGCNQYVTKEMLPPGLKSVEELSDQPEVMCRGGSVIVSPMGEVLAGPLFDEEGILTAELNLADITKAKVDFDVVGHYARPDVFQFNVNTRPQPPLTYSNQKANFSEE